MVSQLASEYHNLTFFPRNTELYTETDTDGDLHIFH